MRNCDAWAAMFWALLGYVPYFAHAEETPAEWWLGEVCGAIAWFYLLRWAWQKREE